MLTFISRRALSRPPRDGAVPVRDLCFRPFSHEAGPVKGDSFTPNRVPGHALYEFPGRVITFPYGTDEEGCPGADYKHFFALYEDGGMD